MDTIHLPSYSPDSLPCDFHICGPLKEVLGGKRFEDNASVEVFVHNWLMTQPRSFYDDGIKKLPISWTKCTSKTGDYVKK